MVCCKAARFLMSSCARSFQTQWQGPEQARQLEAAPGCSHAAITAQRFSNAVRPLLLCGTT